MRQFLTRQLGALHLRLLLVNAIVVLVPVAGLEFASLFERELLRSLERDMRNQAVTIRHFLEGPKPFEEMHEATLMRSAKTTRTRVRVLDRSGSVRLDSHRHGPPEGEEPPAPRNLAGLASRRSDAGPRWKPIGERVEVLAALKGERGAYTRIREREPSVFLFIAEPIFDTRKVVGAVYVTRSTRPVMVELYRIRTGLQQVLVIAMVLTGAVTLWLAYSITRPLERLAEVASRIAKGEKNLEIPVGGSGEIRKLGLAFQAMTGRLEQRMQDTAAFAADVAHGFKSPLTSIRGAAELLSQGAADDSAQRDRFLRNIQLDSERLDRLVSRLLTLSRIEASTEPAQDFDMRQLLEQTARRSETPDVAIQVSGPTHQNYRGRRADLGTALANLMDNAAKFSPPKRSVEVELSALDGALRIRVTDHGPGVPKAAETRIFQRFFTTDSDQGTGLGLAIVKSVVEAHHGRVFLDAAGSTGACFVVDLPL